MSLFLGMKRVNNCINFSRLLEIEVQNMNGDRKALNFQGFVEAVLEDGLDQLNDSYPSPEVMPNSMLGVRNVGLPPPRFQSDKKLIFQAPNFQNLDEKLYYLKHDSPKVYVNVRGHTGNFRKDGLVGPKPFPKKVKTTVEFRDSTSTVSDKKLYSKVPKKYDPLRHGVTLNSQNDYATSTTENPVITSSELPKQIPAPPSKVPVRFPIVHTTPVQRQSRRVDIYPSYTFTET